jgi:hypothetical protein
LFQESNIQLFPGFTPTWIIAATIIALNNDRMQLHDNKLVNIPDALLSQASLNSYPRRPWSLTRANLNRSSKREPLFSPKRAAEKKLRNWEDSTFFDDDGPVIYKREDEGGLNSRRENESGNRSSRQGEMDRQGRRSPDREDDWEYDRRFEGRDFRGPDSLLLRDVRGPDSSRPRNIRPPGETAFKKLKQKKKEKKESAEVVRDAEGFVIKASSSRDPQHKETAFRY